MAARSGTVLLLIGLGLLFFPVRLGAADNSCLGFKLPGTAVEVGENRYRLKHAWDQAAKFYRKSYRHIKGIKKYDVISTPGVKAIHYRNMTKRGKWAGANISNIKGEVFVFCFPKEEPAGKKSKKKKK